MSKLYRYTVRGRGSFPFDMLRYDAAWPTSNGASELSLLASRPGVARLIQNSVELLSHSKPTVGRWNSFGWYVGEVETV
jgi:hypothetical protein